MIEENETQSQTDAEVAGTSEPTQAPETQTETSAESQPVEAPAQTEEVTEPDTQTEEAPTPAEPAPVEGGADAASTEGTSAND